MKSLKQVNSITVNDPSCDIAIYQPNENTNLEVRLMDETVWLTQSQIAMIFNVGRPAITKHIKNIYNCGELEEKQHMFHFGTYG